MPWPGLACMVETLLLLLCPTGPDVLQGIRKHLHFYMESNEESWRNIGFFILLNVFQASSISMFFSTNLVKFFWKCIALTSDTWGWGCVCYGLLVVCCRVFVHLVGLRLLVLSHGKLISQCDMKRMVDSSCHWMWPLASSVAPCSKSATNTFSKAKYSVHRLECVSWHGRISIHFTLSCEMNHTFLNPHCNGKWMMYQASYYVLLLAHPRKFMSFFVTANGEAPSPVSTARCLVACALPANVTSSRTIRAYILGRRLRRERERERERSYKIEQEQSSFYNKDDI